MLNLQIKDELIYNRMVSANDIPDPDRGDKDSFDNSDDQPPQVFINGDSEEDEDTDDVGDHGYQMLQQNEDNNDDEEEVELSREEALAALVRAAQADAENLSDATRELIDESSSRQRAEELEETAQVWRKPDDERDNSIQLSDEKIETIKNLMSGVVLGNIPAWAKDLDTKEVVKSSKQGGSSNN